MVSWWSALICQASDVGTRCADIVPMEAAPSQLGVAGGLPVLVRPSRCVLFGTGPSPGYGGCRLRSLLSGR